MAHKMHCTIKIPIDPNHFLSVHCPLREQVEDAAVVMEGIRDQFSIQGGHFYFKDANDEDAIAFRVENGETYYFRGINPIPTATSTTAVSPDNRVSSSSSTSKPASGPPKVSRFDT